MAGSKVSVSEGSKRLLTNILRAAVSATLLGYVIWLVPIDELGPLARRIDWRLVAASIGVSLIAAYLNAVRMYQLTAHQGISLRARHHFRINLITSFYGLFMPGYIAGGAIRWYYLSKPDGRRAQALAAIVFNRVLETTVLVGLGLAFWFADTAKSSLENYNFVLIATALICIAGYLLVMSPRVHDAVRRLIRAARAPQWLATRVSKVQSALESYSDRRWSFHLRIVSLAILHHVFGLASLLLLVHAVSLDIQFVTIGWVRSVLALALMLPISVGGFGVREVTLVTLLEPYGVSTAAALMLSLLILSRGLVSAALGGVLVAQEMLGSNRRTPPHP